MKDPMRYQYSTFEFYWPDLDNYSPPSDSPYKNFWIGILERAWQDLTFQGHRGDNEMRFLLDAYEFITIDNPGFELCCQVMNLAEEKIEALRELAKAIFEEYYREPVVREWKRRGRKPRGYKEQITTP